MSVSAHQGDLPEQETKQPASVLVQDKVQRTIYGGTKADPGWWAHNSFKGNENPSSVLEEQDDRIDPITKKTGHGWEVAHMDKPRIPHFDPTLPLSVVEEENGTLENNDVWGMPKWKAGGDCGRLYEDGTYKQPYVIPNPSSVLEQDNSLDCYDECEEGAPVSMFESAKCFYGKRSHQTSKPQDILEFFLKYWTDEGDVVLDPTFGGGSTGQACMRMGRTFIGCELDDKYYREGSARIRATLPDAPGKSV
jgi:hypothetical protein